MEISKIIERCISIIAKEIDRIEDASEDTFLDKLECEKLVDYTKTLIAIEKDRRVEEKDIQDFKTDKELEDAILKEAAKIEEKRGQKSSETD